jgi:autotransporter passenger strand-loop-strand repeat protein
VQTSGTAIGTIISSGGSEIVNAGGTANNTTIASGGRLEVLTNGVVGGVVLRGGTADLKSGAKVSAPIALVGIGGTLEIGGSAAPLSAFMSASW